MTLIKAVRNRVGVAIVLRGLTLLLVWLVSGCALLQHDPLAVTVAGLEPLPGDGMEMRMLVKLRVQNPNDTAIEYDGVFVEMRVQGKPLASGVSDARGAVPRYGETVVAIPVTISVLNLARQAAGMMSNRVPSAIDYELRGKLAGKGFSSVRFESQGELSLPPVR